MGASPDDPLAASRLHTWERAATVLAVTHHGDAAPGLLAALAAPAGPRCAAAATALLGLPAAERGPTLAREVARLFAPVPPGLGRVHPTWLDAALADVPPGARAALAGAASAPATASGADVASPATLAWLARRAFGALCALPAEEDPGGTPADAARGPAARLLETLDAAGRDRVALALRHAPRSALAAFCARLPADEAQALVRAVAQAPAAPAAARQAQDELAAAAAQAPPAGDGLALLRHLGARAIGAAVAGAGDTPQQLAQLLPRDLGLALVAAARATAAGAAPGHEAAAAPRPAALPEPGERLD